MNLRTWLQRSDLPPQARARVDAALSALAAEVGPVEVYVHAPAPVPSPRRAPPPAPVAFGAVAGWRGAAAALTRDGYRVRPVKGAAIGEGWTLEHWTPAGAGAEGPALAVAALGGVPRAVCPWEERAAMVGHLAALGEPVRDRVAERAWERHNVSVGDRFHAEEGSHG